MWRRGSLDAMAVGPTFSALLIRKDFWGVGVPAVLASSNAALVVVLPILFGKVVASGFGAVDGARFGAYLTGFLMVSVAISLIDLASSSLIARWSASFESRIRMRAVDHLACTDLRLAERIDSAKVLGLLTYDLGVLKVALSGRLLSAPAALIQLICITVWALFQSKLIAFVIGATVLSFILVGVGTYRGFGARVGAEADAVGEMVSSTTLSTGSAGWINLRNFGESVSSICHAAIGGARSTQFRLDLYSNAVGFLYATVALLSTWCVFVVLRHLVSSGEVGLDVAVAAVVLVGSVVSPTRTLAGLGEELASARVAARRLGSIFNFPYERASANGVCGELRRCRTRLISATFVRELFVAEVPDFLSLEVVDRDLEDDCRRRALRRNDLSETRVGPVSLTLTSGKVLFLGGSNGTGKTTVCYALAGYLDPVAGGVDELESGAKGVYISETPIFPGRTIRDCFGLPASHRDGEFILDLLELPPGMLSKMRGGERSLLDVSPLALSLGEQQWVGVCVALLAKPKLLILDEATSGVSEEYESRLIDKCRREVPYVVLVSHKPGVSSLADESVWL